MNKLRLILWEECHRNCPGCCNNDWDLGPLEVESDYTKYDQILLTGGEPMLYPEKVADTILDIKAQKKSRAKIFMYTALVTEPKAVINLLMMLDGITVTLHDQSDAVHHAALDRAMARHRDVLDEKSLRINVFEGIHPYAQPFMDWKDKAGMKWIKDCPLPKGEVLKRYWPV